MAGAERESRFVYQRRAVRVVFRPGALGDVAAELDRAGLANAFVLATPGRQRDVEKLVATLGSRLAGVFDRAALHVPSALVTEALEAAKRAGGGVSVALGGGSAVGLGKAMAHHIGLPLVAIPTTYSGSEMTEIWGFTDAQGKRTMRDPQVAPRIVIYDPELTTSLSAATSAASGMNAAAHAVEALYAPDRHPPASLAAVEALCGLARSLPMVIARPDDLDARGDALRAAHLAGVALDGTSMGLHHKLCHVLGGSFGLPHAETHAVLLPHVTAYNAPGAPDAMAEIAAALGTPAAAEGLAALNRRLGITYSLRDLGLERADLDRAAAIAVTSTYPNPRPVTAEAVRAILDAAF